MPTDPVATLLLPLVLGFIMLSLGLGLTGEDFRRIARSPRALLVGAVCHFVLLPLVCFGMLKLLGIGGVFAVGFMILAACPTGSTSNLLTYLARGDVALAVSFTAVASVLTVFTLPWVVAGALSHFLGEAGQRVQLPVGQMMLQVFMMLALPVGLGMLLRRLWPAHALRFEPVATRIATVLFVLIVIAAVAKNWPLFRDNAASLAPFAVMLNVAMLLIGFAAAWLMRLSRPQAVTLAIETSVQNATLALVIATSVLQNEAMAVPGALYGVLMYMGGMAFAFAMRRWLRDAPDAAGVAAAALHPTSGRPV